MKSPIVIESELIVETNVTGKSLCDVICEEGKFKNPIRANLGKATTVLYERRIKDPNGIYYLRDVATGIIKGV